MAGVYGSLIRQTNSGFYRYPYTKSTDGHMPFQEAGVYDYVFSRNKTFTRSAQLNLGHRPLIVCSLNGKATLQHMTNKLTY